MIRVGSVNYLNAKPLIAGLTDLAPQIALELDLPSRIADRMHRGALDVGLIPVAEMFRGQNYTFLPGISIASHGPVLSVTLFSRVPRDAIRSVALDEGSRTSATLTKILLRGKPVAYSPLPIDADVERAETDAVLLIGDRAMKACLPTFPHAYDLGQLWAEMTGLPMVYAVWAVRPGVDLGTTPAAFEKAKRLGQEQVGTIAAREAELLSLDAGFCRRYLSHIIRYELGPLELAGLNKFRELAAGLGLVPPGVNSVYGERVRV